MQWLWYIYGLRHDIGRLRHVMFTINHSGRRRIIMILYIALTVMIIIPMATVMMSLVAMSCGCIMCYAYEKERKNKKNYFFHNDVLMLNYNDATELLRSCA
ncbi:MAG: hypothetical protein EAZ74_05200 [Alphaproteobacteria bacterium]|nr:MAG: hypothetical protein EAY76_03860 [Alphaproteobacteria bacterium]TAF13703.1 MAG: hypothetical protein EAZ74_05200 [Alphaproteobacteria bacterium]TAF38347.1 MAG: hypothetical protein EAZ66_06450 [Alphaproteobacteria bacterium]TAF76258.1 MAG: hypothetical protein EAZ52_04210 [Alphaproteobacteria bacterium]